MEVFETELDGVLILKPKIFKDDRGFFMESYNEETFKQLGLSHKFVQDNHSFSANKGTLRGLHYQVSPKAQTKLVKVLTGEIYDVVVDIRKDSNTYGKWISINLSSESGQMLLVPKGFAHGFCTLTPNTHIMYKVDEHYSKPHERGILWDDSTLDIDWPTQNPILSEKDQKLPSIL